MNVHISCHDMFVFVVMSLLDIIFTSFLNTILAQLFIVNYFSISWKYYHHAE